MANFNSIGDMSLERPPVLLGPSINRCKAKPGLDRE